MASQPAWSEKKKERNPQTGWKWKGDKLLNGKRVPGSERKGEDDGDNCMIQLQHTHVEKRQLNPLSCIITFF